LPVLRGPWQIFLNLLSNAVKFTGDGGRVTLRAFHHKAAVCIVVEDTGIGMGPEELLQALSRLGQIESAMTRKTQAWPATRHPVGRTAAAL
jgi:signal transduction histidine kinase